MGHSRAAPQRRISSVCSKQSMSLWTRVRRVRCHQALVVVHLKRILKQYQLRFLRYVSLLDVVLLFIFPMLLWQDDIQPLLGSVNTTINGFPSSQDSNSITAVDPTDTYSTGDDPYTFPEITVCSNSQSCINCILSLTLLESLCSVPDRSSSLDVGFSLDMANQPMSDFDLMVCPPLYVFFYYTTTLVHL